MPDEIWLQHPRLNGHPAGVGWGAGRAVVINCECELARVAPGDVLVTRVAGPALSHILPRVAGVVTERGGSTSHFASLARERGIPMVLGVADATRRIPDGAQVAVDGVAGIVRWIRGRQFRRQFAVCQLRTASCCSGCTFDSCSRIFPRGLSAGTNRCTRSPWNTSPV